MPEMIEATKSAISAAAGSDLDDDERIALAIGAALDAAPQSEGMELREIIDRLNDNLRPQGVDEGGYALRLVRSDDVLAIVTALSRHAPAGQRDDIRAATIEECARVAEGLGDKLYYSHQYAKAIRALAASTGAVGD